MLRVLKVVAINFAVLASLLLIAMIAADIYIRIDADRVSELQKRRALVPNYAGVDWAETHFREVEELTTVYVSFVEWRRELYQGETVNVVGPFHERLTAEAEGAKGAPVFFFGGSTMWGTGARDQETIPSYYSRIAGRPTRNFGESGYVAHQNLEMLLWVLQEGERPAAVVFYDGVNDVSHRCRTGVRVFSQAQEGRMRALLTQAPGLFLRMVDIVAERIGGGEPRDSDRYDCDNDPAKAQGVADAMILDWKLAQQVAQSQGIAFFAVLQPVVYLSDTIADTRADTGREADDQRRLQYETVYPLIKARLAELGALDLTGALDEQTPFFIDFCHLSPNGNERIAKALAAAIEPALPPK